MSKLKNNKGVTLVEMIVSMTLLIIISTFLFQMIISLKELYNSSGIKTEMLTKQANISKMINTDLKEKGIKVAQKCSDLDNCLAFYFEDGTNKTLKFTKRTNEQEAYLEYGDYRLNLVDKSDFGVYKIETSTVPNLGLNNNSILKIEIPITHPLLRNQDFGINIVYQYNNQNTSISNIALNGNNTASKIWLAGSSDMVWYSSVPFEDPGYYYLDSNNNLIKATGTTDVVTVTQSEIVDNKMTINYLSKDGLINETRTVSFIDSTYNYGYNNSFYEFVAPINGVYKIETWGANGNDASSNKGGMGAYASGEIALSKNEKVYIYVGGAGSGSAGGYNGGGNTALNGIAGGGATDIRLRDGRWDAEDGLKSRIMVAGGGGGATSSDCGSDSKIGGSGGILTSSSFVKQNNCSSAWTLAIGASQTSGGNLEIYDASGNRTNTLNGGVFGKASTTYDGTILSGGGGGYYGGASSGVGSPATGGSSFVSGCEGCIALDKTGKVSDSNIHSSGKKFNNIIMEDGKSTTKTKPDSSNNGYARISLVSFSYNS